MKLLYCYIMFLNEKGEKSAYRGMDHVELNLSATDMFTYDVTNNSLQRKERKFPLPAHFWSGDDTDPEYRNIYNVSVLAGENGSGKTTAIRSVMNLLNFFHASVDPAMQKSKKAKRPEIERHRSLLLLEVNGVLYLLDYAPIYWKENGAIQTT